jgi:hypothetical protein
MNDKPNMIKRIERESSGLNSVIVEINIKRGQSGRIVGMRSSSTGARSIEALEV